MRTLIHEPMMFHSFVGFGHDVHMPTGCGLLMVQASPVADDVELWLPVWEFLDSCLEHDLYSERIVSDDAWYEHQYTETIYAFRV